MSIVSFREMLADARRNRYAVPMFDLSNTTMIRAAAESAEELGSPVIFAAIWPDLDGSLLGYWANAARYAATQVKVPVALHLDHATTIEQCRKCADAGFQSVMIDASAEPFEKNVAVTAAVVGEMHRRGLDVEAELGHVAVGVVGSGAESETGAAGDHTPVFTDPASVVEFTGRTGVDALAVSIGTAHGVYESAPNLDIARLAEIDKVSPVPLVLHGGSGTPEDQLRAAIANGIAKINIYSELTAAWNREMFEFLRNRREMTCWFSVSCRRPEEAMREAMRAKMRLFGSAGRA